MSEWIPTLLVVKFQIQSAERSEGLLKVEKTSRGRWDSSWLEAESNVGKEGACAKGAMGKG